MMTAMGSVRGPRARWDGVGMGLAVALAATAVIAVIAVAVWPRPVPGLPGPSAETATPAPSTAVGPLVYYEVLDAAGSRLMERRLDGRSIARQVAIRTDADQGRTWAVDPTGTVAIALVPGRDDQALEAIAIGTGAARWSIRTPIAPLDPVAWSADGRRFAIASLPDDAGPRQALVVDVAAGGLLKVTIPDDATLQGFDAGGGLILRQHLAQRGGDPIGWQFLRIDPGSGGIGRLAGPPDVGPASDGSEDVDPATGIAVDMAIGANDQGTAIRSWHLGGGAVRTLATLPSVDRIAIDPAGTGVAIGAAQTIRFVAFDGRASDLYTGPDPIGDFAWSAGGDYLAVATDRRGPSLTIVELATGRSVELPHPDAIAQLLLVRLVGGVPLPAVPLPAAEPTPPPTPAPSGDDVAGFGGLLSGWVDRTGPTQVAHVERLVPTEAGGIRVAAEMPPLDLGPAAVPDDGGPQLQILPRPRSRDVLLWIETADGSTGWLWDGAATVRRLGLPADWPANAFDLAWRPDGLAIAASAGRATAEGDFEGIFVVASPAGRSTTVVPVVGDYDRLEGWWSGSELRVGHGICTEGCSGRYAFSARLRVRDHRLVQMTPADRGTAPLDEVSVLDSGIVLSMINDDPGDDVTIDWPASLGPIEALEPIGFAADGRSLLVARETADGTDLVRIADPVGRAIGGRVADPRPETVGHLDGRGLLIEMSPDDRWALVTDRVDDVKLVRPADGRTWPLDRERVLAWIGAG